MATIIALDIGANVFWAICVLAAAWCFVSRAGHVAEWSASATFAEPPEPPELARKIDLPL